MDDYATAAYHLIETIVINISFIASIIFLPNSDSDRFHCWLPAAQVTNYRRQFMAS